MNEFDIPIFKKSYDLYRTLFEYRRFVPKPDHYALFERIDKTALDIIECILLASSQQKMAKLPTLIQASLKLNLLRVLVRLMKDTKTLDSKKYIYLESMIDEIGRMLGGWIRSIKE
jgi:23S rRNA-intervening sequence protein